jgi:hypothetical protein
MILPLWVQALMAVITMLGGSAGLVALLTIRPASRRLSAEASRAAAEAGKTDADAASVLSAAAVALLAPTQHEAARLTTQLDAAETRTRRLEDRIRELEATVVSLTDRLELAHRLLTDAGIALPPIPPHG